MSSTLLSVVCYVISKQLSNRSWLKTLLPKNIILISLLTSFITPVSIIFGASFVWALPLGLIIAGALLFDYWRHKSQGYLETAILVMVLGIMWGMYYFGVTNIQAYAHTFAIMFAGFAWWRATNNDSSGSGAYIVSTLAVTTIPLVIQSIFGTAGDLYGWWLLLEQVAFMIIGMIIGKKIMVRWGLYVAVASVLYQLRHLGYMALAFLAMFIIGVAIYQLQKYNKPNEPTE